MIWNVAVWCAIFYLRQSTALPSHSIVTTTSGAVKGKLNVFNGIQYYSYQGIPYAANPTGKLRFQPPVPREPWSGVLDATGEGAVCSQANLKFLAEQTTEDCLIVNVYVPAKTDKILPVMVFIHGGYLQYSSGSIDEGFSPELLLEREIIFVTMNYRLGPFGFLNLGIQEASGNAGLKDVLLSLKWVKQNIKYFGGDVDNITLAGHSAGSLIINFLMLTKKSTGLFNRAMLFSGSAFAPRSFANHPKDISLLLAKELGIETDNEYRILKSLQNVSAIEIIDAYSNLIERNENPFRYYASFVVSTEVESSHALFIKDPIEAVRKNSLVPLKIPIVVGMTSEEAKLIANYVQNQNGVIKVHENPEIIVPSNIEYPIGSEESRKLTKLISEMYFGEDMKKLSNSTLIQYVTDTQYSYGVYYWMKRYQNMTDSNDSYFYVFDFMGDMYKPVFDLSIDGTPHGADLIYVFLTSNTKPILGNIDERSQLMVDMMVNLVSNFVYHGNPTPENLSAANKNLQFKWLNFGNEHNYLLLNENPAVQRFSMSPLYARMQFWEKVYDEYFEYVDRGGEIQKKIIP